MLGPSGATLTVVLSHCWAGDHRDWAHQVFAALLALIRPHLPA